MNVMILGAGGGIGETDHYQADPQVQRICDSPSPMSSIDPGGALADRGFGRPVPYRHWLGQLTNPSIAGFAVPDYWLGPTGGQKTLRQLASPKLQHDYAVNAIGPVTLFAQMAKQLRSAGMRAVFLSAQVGSIEDNRLGGWYGYRMSKAALNMGIRCLAIECGRWRSEPTIVAVHPGTTASNLSKPFTKTRAALVQSPAQCAARLYDLIESLKPQQTGLFLKLSGETLPW